MSYATPLLCISEHAAYGLNKHETTDNFLKIHDRIVIQSKKLKVEPSLSQDRWNDEHDRVDALTKMVGIDRFSTQKEFMELEKLTQNQSEHIHEIKTNGQRGISGLKASLATLQQDLDSSVKQVCIEADRNRTALQQSQIRLEQNIETKVTELQQKQQKLDDALEPLQAHLYAMPARMHDIADLRVHDSLASNKNTVYELTSRMQADMLADGIKPAAESNAPRLPSLAESVAHHGETVERHTGELADLAMQKTALENRTLRQEEQLKELKAEHERKFDSFQTKIAHLEMSLTTESKRNDDLEEKLHGILDGIRHAFAD